MLSVVLATHNEEHNLDRCLAPVAKLADEIIVVDGESTDETVRLAKKHGARVIPTTNKSNFHINKQMAMDEAKGELILQLDADEVVDEELAAGIMAIHRQVMKAVEAGQVAEFQPKAWWLKRRNYFLGRFLTKGGQYPDPVIRLYLHGYARLPQKDVHEQMTVDGEIGWAPGHLLHYGNPAFNDYLRKFNTYTSFKAEQLKEQGVPLSPLAAINHLLLKPGVTFCMLYFRHRGLVDGVAGLVFALMSGLHHLVAYLKLWELYRLQEKRHA